jgi:hypothetical protein
LVLGKTTKIYQLGGKGENARPDIISEGIPTVSAHGEHDLVEIRQLGLQKLGYLIMVSHASDLSHVCHAYWDHEDGCLNPTRQI